MIWVGLGTIPAMQQQNLFFMTDKATVQPVFDFIPRSISEQLRNARGSILVAMAWMGQTGLRDILVDKAANGIPVYLIVSAHGFNDQESSGLQELASRGILVYTWGGEETSQDPLMHNKYCVIDNHTVITGSFNWTRKAEINKENVAIIHGKNVAAEYINDFYQLMRGSVNYSTGQTDPVAIVLTPDRLVCGEGQDVTVEYQVYGADHIRIMGASQEEMSTPGTVVKKNLKSPLTLGIEAIKDGISYHRYISIQVVPKPTLKIHAEPDCVASGQTTVIHWAAENATVVVFLNEERQLNTSGTLTIAPIHHKVYSFKAYNAFGTTEQSIRILVLPVPVISTLAIPLPYGIRIEMGVDIARQPVSVPIPLGKLHRERSMHLPVIQSLRSGSGTLIGLYQKLSQEFTLTKPKP